MSIPSGQDKHINLSTIHVFFTVNLAALAANKLHFMQAQWYIDYCTVLKDQSHFSIILL